MAFTGSLLSSLGRVSVAPSSSSVLLSHHSDAFLSAQSAALESIAATIAKIGGSFGARELARSLSAAALLSARLAEVGAGMEQPVMAVAPVSLVAHRYIVQNQLQSSPTLAIDTWKSLLSILRSAVSTASKVLPVVGGIVIVTAISAIALHVTNVHLPKWKLLKNDINAQEEQNRFATLENNQTHHRIARPDPTGMSVTELQSEIVALRAELDQYRSLIVANKGRESPSAEIGSYEALSESYMRELELTNAKLVHQLNTLTSEVKIHNTREVILMDELSKSMRDRDESVKALETQVETLQNEKQSVEGRVKGLEEELGELRELFQSLAASKSRSSSRMSSRSSGMTSVSRGRRSVRSGSDVDPIIPILSLENSSLWDKNSVRSTTERVEPVGVVEGGGDVGLGGEMWESVFAEGEKLKGGNVLD